MAVQTQGSTLVAKEWLVDFIAEYTVAHPGRLSKINSLLIEEYTANALSLSICPPDKNQFTCVRDQSAYRWCVTANEQ
jgi:hypothetical protein